LRLIVKACAVLLIGTMVWAVHGLAMAQSAQPATDDPTLVRVVDHGGLCTGGQECSAETVVLAGGAAVRQSAGAAAVSYPINAEQIGQLASLIASADFTTLAGPPFTGVCPTAYDGSERIYVFASADGLVTLAGCQVEIDHAAPLIALVDTIVDAGQSGGTGPVATPVPTSPVGYLEGQVAIGPLQPVERVGVPPPTPSMAVCTARGLVLYRADTGAEAVRFPLGPDCSYRVALPPGSYRVELDRRGIDFSKDLPRGVAITAGQTTRLDLSIDTGIR
jgi:hypothetical protein